MQQAVQQMTEQYQQRPAPDAVDADELRKLGDSVVRPIVVSVREPQSLYYCQGCVILREKSRVCSAKEN